jgi:uncharacterized membrane protein
MRRPIGQKIAYLIAVLCYLLGAACALGVVFYHGEVPQDPVRASLMASVVFFIGCGIVLHVIGTARLAGLLSGDGETGRE